VRDVHGVCATLLQLCAVVVFGCITDQGWVNNSCVYNNNGDACRFGSAIGIIAFLALMAFLVSDAMIDTIVNVMHKKYIIVTDIAFSGAFTTTALCLQIILPSST